MLSFSAVPADLGTSITVEAKLKQDGSPVTGLDFEDFLLKVDGTTANPTADDSEATGAGKYVLTVSALATNESLEISLYDTANNRGAIELDGALFKSNTATATVV